MLQQGNPAECPLLYAEPCDRTKWVEFILRSNMFHRCYENSANIHIYWILEMQRSKNNSKSSPLPPSHPLHSSAHSLHFQQISLRNVREDVIPCILHTGMNCLQCWNVLKYSHSEFNNNCKQNHISCIYQTRTRKRSSKTSEIAHVQCVCVVLRSISSAHARGEERKGKGK